MNGHNVIPISAAGTIVNMDAMARGTGARYLECSLHENETGQTLIAYKWRRKLPIGIPSWHRIVDFVPVLELTGPKTKEKREEGR